MRTKIRPAILARITIIAVALLASQVHAQDPATDSGAEEAFLPTPYTAEQIRDAWQVGLTVTTLVRSSQGEGTSRTVVTEWGEEKVSMVEQPLDDKGEAVGDGTPIEVTWAALRDHARFPAASATRERTTANTPLGELEGWRYIMRHSEVAQSEFFFADAYPGPPVIFLQRRDGEVMMRAEMVGRELAP